MQALLRTALWLKALQGSADQPRFARCVNTLQSRAQLLLDAPRAVVFEEKVRMRLSKQRDHLFTFLQRAEVPATNNLAERQLRPAVIARKISCGNKTEKGAQAWAVLASLAATSQQTDRSVINVIASPRRASAGARPLSPHTPLNRYCGESERSLGPSDRSKAELRPPASEITFAVARMNCALAGERTTLTVSSRDYE